MNKVLLTGLGIGKTLDLCESCNLDFTWLIYNPSVLLWADKILLPEDYLKCLGTEKNRFNALVNITLEMLDKNNVLELISPKFKYSAEEQVRIYIQFLRDKNNLLTKFPSAVKTGKDVTHNEFFINDVPYCAPYILSLYGAIELANKNKAHCLFNRRDIIYLNYLNEIKSDKIERKDQIYSEVFSTLLPNDSIIPKFALERIDKCHTCQHESSCKDEYDCYEKTLNKALEYRDYDEFCQAKKVVDKIISKKDEIIDDQDIKEVIRDFNEKKAIINKRIKGLFPKVKRWTNMATVISTPLAITSGILSVLHNTNTIIPISSGAITGIAEVVNKAIETYTDNNRWISFLDKNQWHE